jgi:putative alpha-1,2-mannosidase
MSSWLVFTSLGFYPVAPGSNQYVLGRPFVNRAALSLPGGKRFTVLADGLSAANRYVGKVTLNGKPLARSYITHEELTAGGELHFTMQATPNKSWATSRAARPFSTSAGR